MSFGPFSAFYLMFYEELKTISTRYSSGSIVSTSHIMMSAAVAGALASFLTNPLDMAKLRIQVQRGNKAFRYDYKSVFHGVIDIARHEGFGTSGLLKGVGARMAFHAPSTAITITLYEVLKHQYLELFGYL